MEKKGKSFLLLSRPRGQKKGRKKGEKAPIIFDRDATCPILLSEGDRKKKFTSTIKKRRRRSGEKKENSAASLETLVTIQSNVRGKGKGLTEKKPGFGCGGRGSQRRDANGAARRVW